MSATMSTPRRLRLAREIRAADPAVLEPRQVAGAFFRQSRPRSRATELLQVAKAEGRYHKERGQPPLYASSTEDTAWGELFRHHFDADLSPFEVRRRMSKIELIDLPVLDLTDLEVRRALGITKDDLVANDFIVCQAIAELVRRRPDRFGGILAPSAAIRTEQTLVVFQERLQQHVAIRSERVGGPPRRLFGLFELIIDTLPARLRPPLRYLAAQIRHELQRLP